MDVHFVLLWDGKNIPIRTAHKPDVPMTTADVRREVAREMERHQKIVRLLVLEATEEVYVHVVER